MYGVIFNNGRVALTRDLIFGLCVYGEDADGIQDWIPWSSMNEEEMDLVRRLLDHNPTCPEEWRNEIYAR